MFASTEEQWTTALRSRALLQQSALLDKIKSNLVNKVLGTLDA